MVDSYQKKYDGATGTYQSIAGSSEISTNGPARGGYSKWIIGAVVAAALGAIYTYTMPKRRANAQEAIDSSISKSTKISFQENGKLKLFDDQSEYNSCTKTTIVDDLRVIRVG